jgi:hypothetical protein
VRKIVVGFHRGICLERVASRHAFSRPPLLRWTLRAIVVVIISAIPRTFHAELQHTPMHTRTHRTPSPQPDKRVCIHQTLTLAASKLFLCLSCHSIRFDHTVFTQISALHSRSYQRDTTAAPGDRGCCCQLGQTGGED